MSKSKKAVFLNDWKQHVGSNMELFHEGTALMVRKHQKSNIKTTHFASTLHDMATHELCPSIKLALDTLSTEVNQAETARAALLSQLQAHLVNEFAKYPHKLKVQEVNIRARNKAFEKFVKKQKSFVALKGNANPTRQAHAKEVFDHERQRLHSAETTLNASLQQFESARVKEMQAMLKKYISSQIHFMSKSIEGLSAAYAKVCEIDGDREGERLVEEMKKLENLEQKDDHAIGDVSQLPQDQATGYQMGYPAPGAGQQVGQVGQAQAGFVGNNPGIGGTLPQGGAQQFGSQPPVQHQPFNTGYSTATSQQFGTQQLNQPITGYPSPPPTQPVAGYPQPQANGYPSQTGQQPSQFPPTTQSPQPYPQPYGATQPISYQPSPNNPNPFAYGYSPAPSRPYTALGSTGQFTANGYTLTNVEAKI